MKIVFLGTNGWYTTPTGNTSCTLIDSKESYIVLDAGNGIYQIDQYIKDSKKPIHIFISHFHIDHISGLQIFYKFKFTQKIYIYVQNKRREYFDRFMNFPFMGSPSDLNHLKINVIDIEEGRINTFTKVDCFKMHHPFDDWGYRLEIGNKIISYSGDTEICENSIPLAKNSDILIHECSWKDDEPRSTWGHVSPKQAATLAKKTGVKKLVLTHFQANIYTTNTERKEAQKKAKEIFPNTTAAHDGLILDI